MKAIRRICAVLIGFVFFGAGLLKLMDPVGAGLVAGEYFNLIHAGILAPLANIAGVFMALLETFLGIGLICGVFPVATGILSGVVITAFTILTFVMWRLNVPMECGCFGEAIHLTHFQSFIKNVALCVLWVVAFIPFSSAPKPRKLKFVSLGIASLSVILFTLYSILSIPPIDFTSFKPGATLMQAEQSPSPDAPLLSVCDSEGEYRDDLLAAGDWLLMSVYEPESAPEMMRKRIAQAEERAAEAGLGCLVLMSSVPEDLPQAFSADRRSIMTLNRSNGGVTLLRDGMIVAKWPFRSLPSQERLGELTELDPTEAMVKENTPKRLRLQGFLLYVFAVLLLL